MRWIVTSWLVLALSAGVAAAALGPHARRSHSEISLRGAAQSTQLGLRSRTSFGTVVPSDAAAVVRTTGTVPLTNPPSGVMETTAPDTLIDSGPSGTVNSSSGSFSFHSTAAGSTFECQLDGGGFSACTSPKSYSGLPDGSHTFQVRAIDSSGNVDPTPAIQSWIVDTTPPETTIDSGPSGSVGSARASFGFHSSEAGSSFQCSLDNGPFVPCSSPQSYGGLASGPHSFQVRATDAAGNSDPTPATQGWTVTLTAYPAAVIADSPAGYWRLGEAGGSSALDSAANLLDGAYIGSPTLGQPGVLSADPDTAAGFNGSSQYLQVPYNTALNPGVFTVEAWAKVTGGAGTYRSIVTSRSNSNGATGGYTIYASASNNWEFWLGRGTGWYITTGPAVQLNQWTLLDASYDGSNVRLYINGTLAATGTLSGYQPNTSRPLRIAAGTTETSPNFYTPGQIDEAAVYNGALSASQVDEHYDAALPETAIDSGPSGSVGSARASFGFHSSEAGSSFQCSLDNGPFVPCSSPQSYGGLASGPHSFQVRATDAAGNSDPTPATQGWTVTLTAYPAAVIADSPAGYWRLGEAGGSSALDSAANLLDGAYIGSPTLGQPGVLSADPDTAAGFNGSSQYLQVPYNTALNPGVFTVEAWAKVTGGAGTYRSIVTSRSNSNGATGGYTIYASASNNWEFWLGRGTGWYITTGPAVQLNQWTLLDASYDGSNVRLYINGTLAATGTLSGYQPNTSRPLRIAAGTTETSPNFYTPGQIDEAAVYNGALSAARVQAHFSAAGLATAPGAPTNARATAGDGQAAVSWSAPASDGGSPILHYDVQAFDNGLAGAVIEVGNVTSTTFSQLTNGHSYTFKATAINGVGFGASSAASNGIVPGVYPAAVGADNPVGFYRLDEPSGANALDSSGNAHDGSYIGSPSLGQTGVVNGDAAVSFNGSGQYAQMPYSPALNPGVFTVESWAKVTGGAGSYRSIVTSRSNSNGSTGGYTIYAGAGNNWEFWLGRGSGWYTLTGPAVQLNQWTLLDASFDGTNAKLYVNGTLAASGTLSGYQPNTSRPLRIAAGSTEGAATFYTPGLIDETAIYGTPLSGTRIQAHYSAGAVPPPGFLVPQWRYGYSNDLYAATAAADGENVMDVGSKSAADATPAGTVGLVWVGDYDNTRCRWEVSDSQLQQIVQSGIGDPKILGYFISDEPDPYACPNAVGDHKTRSALIKSIDPNKITFIVVDSNSGPQTLAQIPLWKGAADYIGYDPYPCHTGTACDYSWIDQVVAAADASGNPYWLILQAFASASWRWPTPDEESHMLQQAAKSHLAGIGIFSWNWNNDTLVNHPDVLQVIANYMLAKDFVTPSSPSGLSTSNPGQSSLTLSWTAATDNTAVASYRLYRNGTQVDTTAGLAYQFSGLACGTTYSLGVAAVDTGGNVGPTATLSAATSPCPVIVAAGDICGSATDCAPTANLIGSITPTAVLPLGDNAYSSGSATEYANYYDPNWGKYKAITHPTPGNHEYNTPGAAGYFAYFNNPLPYYSYDIGAWHLISLNGDVSSASGSAQETWLKNDLATHANMCTLAYWHEPRWSSDTVHGDSTSYGTIWTDLYNGGADLVLNGHAHDYERFAPQNPAGNLDTAHGIREFVVGTGGDSHYTFKATLDANSEIHDNTSFGVLKLTLHTSGYDWQFVPVPGAVFSDAGSSDCH